MFDADYIKELPDDPILALEIISNNFTDKYQSMLVSSAPDFQDECITSYVFVQLYIQKHNVDIELNDIDIKDTEDDLSPIIRNIFSEIYDWSHPQVVKMQRDNLLKAAETKYGKLLDSNVHAYDFTEDEYTDIQEYINQLRDAIQSSTCFEEPHKTRLLKRLEKLQGELHKTKSDMDCFFGLWHDLNLHAHESVEAFKAIAEPAKCIFQIVNDVIKRTDAINNPAMLPFAIETSRLLTGG